MSELAGKAAYSASPDDAATPREACLPEPYYADDLVTLYHGDCREVPAWLAADVLVTDPPYGIAYVQGGPRVNVDGVRSVTATAVVIGDATTIARDAALGLWGTVRPALVFGSWKAPRPASVQQRLIWFKRDRGEVLRADRPATHAGRAGLRGGIVTDAEAVLAEAQRRAQHEHDTASPQWRLYGTFEALAQTFGAAAHIFQFNRQRGYQTRGDCALAILKLAEAYLGEAIVRD